MIGYLTSFSADVSLITFVDHSDHKAGNMVSTGEIVRPRIYSLTNYARVNYDGVSPSPIESGTLTQNIVSTNGAVILFDTLQDVYLSTSDLLTFTDLSLTKYYTDAVLTILADNTPFIISDRDFMIFDITFDILSPWRSTP